MVDKYGRRCCEESVVNDFHVLFVPLFCLYQICDVILSVHGLCFACFLVRARIAMLQPYVVAHFDGALAPKLCSRGHAK